MIVVMVDEPQGVHYGGLIAAPVFKRSPKPASTTSVHRAPVIDDDKKASDLDSDESATLRGGHGSAARR